MIEQLKIKDRKSLYLYIIFGLLVSIFISLFVYSVFDGRFFIINEDETIYYNSAKIFYEANSVKSFSCINEDVSPILQTAWYGPFYHLFYGSIAKVFGYNHLNFVITNFILVLLSFLLIFKSKLSINTKLISCISILAADSILKNVFSYFPETLHIFFAIVLILILVRLYYQEENKRNLWTYVLFVLLFSLFRVSTIFWLIGIIPFAKTRKQGAIYLGVLFLGILLTTVYMKFFTAPAYAVGIKNIDYLFNLEIGNFINAMFSHLWINLSYLFTQPSITIFIILFLIILTSVRAIKNHNKLQAAAALICVLIFIILVSLYTTDLFYFEKQTAVLIPLLVISNLIENKNKLIILILFLGVMPYSIANSITGIDLHKQAHDVFIQREDMVAHFNKVSELVDQTKSNYIIWNYSEHDYPRRTTEAIIPVSNNNGFPILWTTNICDPIAPENIKFASYGKLHIDYVLSKYPLHSPGLTLLEQNNYFNFYKIKY